MPHHSDCPPLDQLQLLHIFVVSTQLLLMPDQCWAEHSAPAKSAQGSILLFHTSPALFHSVKICVLGSLLNIFPQNYFEKSSLMSRVSAVSCFCLKAALIHCESYTHLSDHACNSSRSLCFNHLLYNTCSLLLLEIIYKFNNDSFCVIIQLINEYNGPIAILCGASRSSSLHFDNEVPVTAVWA